MSEAGGDFDGFGAMFHELGFTDPWVSQGEEGWVIPGSGGQKHRRLLWQTHEEDGGLSVCLREEGDGIESPRLETTSLREAESRYPHVNFKNEKLDAIERMKRYPPPGP